LRKERIGVDLVNGIKLQGQRDDSFDPVRSLAEEQRGSDGLKHAISTVVGAQRAHHERRRTTIGLRR
jgi:sRNA-binding regulator protein Hfq